MNHKKIGIIGLGYVGLPLASLFLDKYFSVYGIDIDHTKIDSLVEGKSYLSDFTNKKIESLFENNLFHVSTNFEFLKVVDIVILCVPTPLNDKGNPNLSYLNNALSYVAHYAKKGQLIILESSTYPGTTEELISPLLTQKGFIIGHDIHVAFSPERINPGQNTYQLQQIPKVVGGVTPSCTQASMELYREIFEEVICVSSPKVAEMTKLLENSQRLINISFMNEMAMLCDRMEINLWEVIEAASTKPFGFTPYFPGPGVGGHCIPVDPLYLSWKAKEYNFDLQFIDIAHQINEKMPLFVINKIEKHLTKTLDESKILAIGVTYKKDVNDVRESSSLRVFELLNKKGANISFYDPYIDEIGTHKSISLTRELLQSMDCAIILTDHSNLPYELIVRESKLIFDTKNATKHIENNGNIILL